MVKRKKKGYRYYHGTTWYVAQQIKETGVFRKGTLTRDKSLAERWVLKVINPEKRRFGTSALVEIVLGKPPRRKGKVPWAFDVGRMTFVEGLLKELRVKPSQIRIAKRRKGKWIWQ